MTKMKNKILPASLMLLAISAGAHAPIGARHSHGGGGITQNVVVGPIKRRPVSNVAVEDSAVFDPSIELGVDLFGAQPPALHVQTVFLGQKWHDPRFANDKITGLERFFRGYEGSGYSEIVTEYAGPDMASVFPSVQYEGFVIDNRRMMGPLFPQRVAQEVCSLADQGKLTLQPNDYYRTDYIAVFSSHKRPAGESCGWHGWTLGCGGSGILFSFSYDLDNDSKCDPNDRVTGHSRGLAALANFSARALSDVRTDSDFNGWSQINLSGNEIDDMCAWTFSVPFVTFSNGSIWKLQDLWSNKAYEAGTGAPNAWGQKGCVTGK